MKTTLRLILLLADDDEDDRVFFREALGELSTSVELREAGDGAELMHMLSNDDNLPDALFLDLNMPFKNGFECLREIKQNAKLKSLVIFIYSTSFQQDVTDRLYTCGAHYYIRKPDNFEELKRLLEQALGFIHKNAPQPIKKNFVLM